ncbi:DUF309 domain-containing protein [Hydrogenimonas cancrithermarum]|uniref:DUF309 domain-containing protein n=1 Tax=Hydrogenimonas cancrithermarum TaxID=2993563 RepID=A0ABN6WW78_9BACT|nr:DUF309 domain-containing protein [Hydrogenimonas cancrithermarum]BDY13123.1 hypothetical protein HCR_14350 [Hydrogenimonas cancrithermarum]
MGEACQTFVQLIEAGDYYEAHEALEEIWYPKRFEKDNEISLIKGFINASVAFELVKKGRMEPARKTWKVYLKYRTLIECVESEHLPLYRKVDALLEQKYEQLFGA